jgi:hypothetical protein
VSSIGPVALFVVAVAAVIAVAVFAYRRAKARREALLAFATTHHMEYSRDDPFGLIDLPFRLFSLGDGRGCENVMWGSWKGVPVREADYWYYDESTDTEGHTSRSYHRFSMVLADLGLSIPQIAIQREGLLSRLADHLGFQDIQFESEDFNRRFQIKAADREFAYKLVDARMMRWLLEGNEEERFELVGNQLLVAGDRRGPGELSWLFDRALAFREHVPRLVWNEYGTGHGAGTDERSAP